MDHNGNLPAVMLFDDTSLCGEKGHLLVCGQSHAIVHIPLGTEQEQQHRTCIWYGKSALVPHDVLLQ
jgi:hypothetical protein